ncbi:hypothetical protein [Simkania sp.]|uniref:hypothetical protein n=1 Tax=Simkania sp. TaxID=34094 RepID=UPI003B528362
MINSLTEEFTSAYNGALNGGDSAGMKQIEDVITNAETQQNQINSTASTNLSADQQKYNSYESTLKNSLSMILSLEKSANSHMAQASS